MSAQPKSEQDKLKIFISYSRDDLKFADQLDAALLVNPHDIAATADAIHRALVMSLEERIERWTSLDRAVREHDIVWWRRSAHCPPATRPVYRRLMWRGVRDGLLLRRGRNAEIHRIAALADAPEAG